MSETALVRAVRAQQLEPVEYDDEHGYEKKTIIGERGFVLINLRLYSGM